MHMNIVDDKKSLFKKTCLMYVNLRDKTINL